jgi:hypothetical protein
VRRRQADRLFLDQFITVKTVPFGAIRPCGETVVIIRAGGNGAFSGRRRVGLVLRQPRFHGLGAMLAKKLSHVSPLSLWELVSTQLIFIEKQNDSIAST